MACVPRHGKTPRERLNLRQPSPSNDEEVPMDIADDEEETPLTWRQMDSTERLNAITKRLKRIDARAGRFMRIHPCETSALMYG